MKAMIMKKKQYEKPAMQVVVLNQRSQILAGSPNGERSPYTPTPWE
jgi:hypothetical protein